MERSNAEHNCKILVIFIWFFQKFLILENQLFLAQCMRLLRNFQHLKFFSFPSFFYRIQGVSLHREQKRKKKCNGLYDLFVNSKISRNVI